jgi:16S rRNA (guanine527-N7)-methyltransferase
VNDTSTETISEIVRRGANGVWNLGLSEGQLAQLTRYAELLVEWNATRLNLTRLTAPQDIAVKHFLDSLALLTVLELPFSARVIDVGTGAGLPGLALKIARPDLQVTLLDSTAKKLAFCRAVADDLGLDSVEIVHARAEDAANLPFLAGQFDLVTARAVAPLERLLPWLSPFAARHGRIAAWKGGGAETENAAAQPIVRKLGLTASRVFAIDLPELEESNIRNIIVLGKYSIPLR